MVICSFNITSFSVSKKKKQEGISLSIVFYVFLNPTNELFAWLGLRKSIRTDENYNYV
jgi:hypothetical protein